MSWDSIILKRVSLFGRVDVQDSEVYNLGEADILLLTLTKPISSISSSDLSSAE